MRHKEQVAMGKLAWGSCFLFLDSCLLTFGFSAPPGLPEVEELRPGLPGRADH